MRSGIRNHARTSRIIKAIGLGINTSRRWLDCQGEVLSDDARAPLHYVADCGAFAMSAPVSAISRHAILRRLWRMEDENKALKAENAKLRAGNRHISAAFPPHWGLTACEAAVLSALMDSFSVRSRELLARVSPGRELNIITVFMFRLRGKLCDFGVKIACSRRTGYSISPSHKAVILSEIEAASFPPIAPVLAAMVAGRLAAGA